MTGFVRDHRKSIAADPRRITAYRRAAAGQPLRAQVERTLIDIANLSTLSSRQDLAGARGAALALAHTALVLAVTPVNDGEGRRRRATMLCGAVLPVLGSAGLGHLGALIEAALAHEGDPAGKVTGVETEQ